MMQLKRTLAYKISFTEDALAQFSALDKPVKVRIDKVITKLAALENPKDRLLPLSATLAGFYKLRIGDYRLIFEVKAQQLVLIVVKVGHRREVYKQRAQARFFTPIDSYT